MDTFAVSMDWIYSPVSLNVIFMLFVKSFMF
jgi:hypothetical protein